jgi:hypothetical protein
MRILIIAFIVSLCALTTSAQTPLPIYSPNFSNAGGWQINGNASIISSSYLRLTPNAGGQSGSAFWKQKVSLPADYSFATYFTSKMIPGTRADGMTFCIQQASNTAGSSGGGLGYQGMPGKSIAIEYDTYNNGEVGGNNHIALDINGILHTGSTNVVASPVDLADGAMKYNWIEYNGSTKILEVRISNSNVRPTLATLSISALNLSSNFAGVTDVYFGFTAATGGATEEHDVYAAYVAPNSTPLSSSGNYTQGVASITLASSNSVSCSSQSSTITITTKNVSGVGIPTTVKMSFDAGGGLLSQSVITTNILGTATLTFSSNSNTLASNTVRAEDTIVRAYGTVVVTQSGVVPVGGTVSSATNSSVINSGTLTLTGYTGTISKWQRSTDGGNTWADIVWTSASYNYTNQLDGTQYRAVITGGGCTAYSQAGIITINFYYSGYVYNSESFGVSNIPVSLYYEANGQTSYTLYNSYLTDATGKYTITTTLPSNSGLFRISISNLYIGPPSATDAKGFNQKIFKGFNSRDYYRMDVNSNNNLTISDVFLTYYKNGGISSWPNSTPAYRLFNSTEWSTIMGSTGNLKSLYPGVQSINVDGVIIGGNTNFYIIRTGYLQ